MSLIDFVCQRAWALEETTLGRLVSIAERAGRAEAVESPEVRAAVEANKARRKRIEADRAAAMEDQKEDKAAVDQVDPEEAAAIQPFMVGSIAVIPIEGVIAAHASMVNGDSQPSGTTGPAIIKAMTTAVDMMPRAKAVLLDFDSPGGTVAGCEEVAQAARELGAKKPIVAYAHGQMASAAYWIGSQAQKVFAGRTSPVGSIGVFAVYDDSSKNLEKYGVTRHIVRSGPNKGTIWPGVPVSEKAIASKQAEVDGLYAVMLGDVAQGRGVPVAQMAPAADGRVFIGQQAMDAGLIDGVMGYSQVLALMEDQFGSMSTTQRGFFASAHQQGNAMVDKKPAAETETKPETAPIAAAPAAAPAAPAKLAASFVELKAAFAGKPGGAELIVEAQDKGLSLVEAYGAYTAKLEAMVANPPTAPAAPARPGVAVAPIQTLKAEFTLGSTGQPGAEPGKITTYADAVKAELKAMPNHDPVKDMPTAMYNAGKKYPKLHLAWVEDRCPAIEAA